MRNFKCYIADLRKRVFAEVARLAYEGGDYRRMEKLPYEIVPGEVGNQRSSIFLERAIVGERIRLAWDCPCVRWRSTACSATASRRAPWRRSITIPRW